MTWQTISIIVLVVIFVFWAWDGISSMPGDK